MPPAAELVEHFFRHEFANLVSVLTRAFGWRRIDLIEDMVSAAIVDAMQTWSRKGVPENPAAWIHRVARNRVVDALRREQVHEKAVAFAGHSNDQSTQLVDDWLDESRLHDSLLRMMFVCCHPAIDRTSQIAMTLKILGGFSIAEIASGLLMSAESVKKRIQRAKAKLSSLDVQLSLPATSELHERMAAIHEVLYLMFNEGYSTSGRVEPIRDEVCEEAARLCHLLCDTSEFSYPETRALLALMLFHGARLESRLDRAGEVVLLEDQDRSQWDRGLIRVAMQWLAKATEPLDGSITERRSEGDATDADCLPPVGLGNLRSRFHLEAAIAMHHCCAGSVDSTDWAMIIHLYDSLLSIHDSPLYILNRAIAKSQVGRFDEATSDLEMIEDSPLLAQYPLLECALARVYERQGRFRMARAALQRALRKAPAAHEAAVINRQLRRLDDAL